MLTLAPILWPVGIDGLLPDGTYCTFVSISNLNPLAIASQQKILKFMRAWTFRGSGARGRSGCFRFADAVYAFAAGGFWPAAREASAAKGILGMSIIAAMKKPSASAVSKMPWRDGQMAATSVMARIVAAGSATPASASHAGIRVSARTAIMVSATPAEISTAGPREMYSWAKYISG